MARRTLRDLNNDLRIVESSSLRSMLLSHNSDRCDLGSFPVGLIVNSTAGELNLALKHYEAIIPRENLEGLESDSDDVIIAVLRTENRFPRGPGWVISSDQKEAYEGGNRRLVVNVWDLDHPYSIHRVCFSYERGNPKSCRKAHPEDTRVRAGVEIPIDAYERVVWKKFLRSEQTNSDFKDYLSRFYSLRVDPQ